jgi:hypothetical protein
MTVITTVPNVSYVAYLTDGGVMDIHNQVKCRNKLPREN